MRLRTMTSIERITVPPAACAPLHGFRAGVPRDDAMNRRADG